MNCFCGSPMPTCGALRLTVCSGCRIFFYRIGKASDLPPCKTGGHCFDVQELSQCRFCRYRKCKEAGMKPEEDDDLLAEEATDDDQPDVDKGKDKSSEEDQDSEGDGHEDDVESLEDEQEEVNEDESNDGDESEDGDEDSDMTQQMDDLLADMPSTSNSAVLDPVVKQWRDVQRRGMLNEYLDVVNNQPGDKYLGYYDTRDDALRDFVTSSKKSSSGRTTSTKIKIPDFASPKIVSVLADLIKRKEKLAGGGEVGKTAYFNEAKNIGIKAAFLELNEILEAEGISGRSHKKGKILQYLASSIGLGLPSVRTHFNEFVKEQPKKK